MTDDESDIDEPTQTPEKTPANVDAKAASPGDRTHQPLWDIQKHFRQAMVNRQISLCIGKDSKPAVATAAFRALLSAEEQNLAEARIAAARPPVWELALVGEVSQLRSELLNNAAFIDFLRRDAAHRDASTVCNDGQPGTLEPGQAPDVT